MCIRRCYGILITRVTRIAVKGSSEGFWQHYIAHRFSRCSDLCPSSRSNKITPH